MSSVRLRGFLPGLLLPLLLAQPAPSAPLTDAEVKARVEGLLAQMTVAEKVGQLNQIAGAFFPGVRPEESLRRGAAGSVLWVNDTKRFNELQKIAVSESRLKIPVLYGLDVIHGYRTVFPVPLALAASWDPALHERAAAVAAREARAAGIHWTFAPMGDIARDARWGAHRRGRRRGPPPRGGDGGGAGARLPGARPRHPGAGCSRAPSTSPPTARRRAGATTTPCPCPRATCATCTCRRSTRRSRPAWAR